MPGDKPCPNRHTRLVMTRTEKIEDLLAIMARLRDPEGGCPWDIEQDFKTIACYTIEEAYEVADAIERGDKAALKDELGDLLFQVVYHARMAEEDGDFSFADVVHVISEKMVRRHPHVFGDEDGIKSADAQTEAWEEHKAVERDKKGQSILDDVPGALPALVRAEKLQKRAARVGFDWPEVTQVLDKIEEEIKELRFELKKFSAPSGTIKDELGDLLFALVNLARWIKVGPEDALRAANSKFVKRFHFIEKELEAEGRDLKNASLEEMESLWQRAKTNT